MKLRDSVALLVAVGICEGAGFIGALASMDSIPSWYAGLVKPPLTPPGAVFGPVWTTLYACMGVAAFLVWRRGVARREVRVALMAFGAQLLLNATWSPAFFGWRRPDVALGIILALCATLAWTIALFRKISVPAAWLLVPYLLWTCFATYLTYAFWILN